MTSRRWARRLVLAALAWEGLAAPTTLAGAPDYTIPGRMTMPWACGEAHRVTWEATGHWAEGKATGLAHDFSMIEGTAVYAPVSGTAYLRYDDRPLDTNLGNYVEIVDESGGWLVRLAHLRDPQLGERAVRAGEQVGFSGSSGVPTAHLHLELLVRSGSRWAAPELARMPDLYGLPVGSYVEGALVSPQGCAPQLTMGGEVTPVTDRVPLGQTASLILPLRNDGRAELTLLTVQAMLFAFGGASHVATAEGEWTLAPVSDTTIVVPVRLPVAGDWYVGRVTYRTDTQGGGMPAKGKMAVAPAPVRVEELAIERPVLYAGDALSLTVRLHNRGDVPFPYDALVVDGQRPDGLPWSAATRGAGSLLPGETSTVSVHGDSVLGMPGVWHVRRVGYRADGQDYYLYACDEMFYLFGPEVVATSLDTLVSDEALHVFLTLENRGTHTAYPDKVEVWGWRADGETSFSEAQAGIRPIAAGATAYVQLDVADDIGAMGWRLVEAGVWQQGVYSRVPLPERAAVGPPSSGLSGL